VPFTQGSDGLHLRVPRDPVGRHAYVFRIDAK
jgi:alpha-L-fucosidase